MHNLYRSLSGKCCVYDHLYSIYLLKKNLKATQAVNNGSEMLTYYKIPITFGFEILC